MMGSMGYAASHDPGPRSPHVEKLRLSFPPRLDLTSQRNDALGAVFSVPAHEFQSDFVFRKRWRSDIDIEHCPKPDIFADTLVHHMLPNAASARIRRVRPGREILVSEHAPGADHFEALGLVSLNQ